MPIWGRDSHFRLIVFRWVGSTTNQTTVGMLFQQPHDTLSARSPNHSRLASNCPTRLCGVEGFEWGGGKEGKNFQRFLWGQQTWKLKKQPKEKMKLGELEDVWTAKTHEKWWVLSHNHMVYNMLRSLNMKKLGVSMVYIFLIVDLRRYDKKSSQKVRENANLISSSWSPCI